jgi:hypothetical protein
MGETIMRPYLEEAGDFEAYHGLQGELQFPRNGHFGYLSCSSELHSVCTAVSGAERRRYVWEPNQSR